MRMLMLSVIVLSLGATAFGMRSDSGGQIALAVLLDDKGERIGQAVFTELPQGIRITVFVSGLSPGIHAMHIETVGEGQGPDFRSCGEHFNPFGKKHGTQSRDGPHAGDLPNLEVRVDGTAEVEVTSLLLTLRRGRNSLLPSGKTCLAIHENPDDEMTDPTGNAGNRIACGPILKQ
jgi:Cu-Zn family superoxide dismutase